MNSEAISARERRAAADHAAGELMWGMQVAPDPRSETTPPELARAAFIRGDQLFQIDLPVTVVQGYAQMGQTGSRSWRPEPYDMLGAIEREGWHLEHVSSTYVINGTSSTKRILGSAGTTEVAHHGSMLGLYVFRRSSL